MLTITTLTGSRLFPPPTPALVLILYNKASLVDGVYCSCPVGPGNSFSLFSPTPTGVVGTGDSIQRHFTTELLFVFYLGPC